MTRGAKLALSTAVCLIALGGLGAAWLFRPAPSFDWPSRLTPGYTLVEHTPTASRLQLEIDGGFEEREEWILNGKGPALAAAKKIAARLGPAYKVYPGSDGIAVETEDEAAPALLVYNLPGNPASHKLEARGGSVHPGDLERRLAPILARCGILRKRQLKP